MEGLASLSVKSMLPTSCCNIAKTKEYLVDIEKREVREGDEDQFQDKKQTLLLKLTETVSRNQISIVARGYVNSVIKEILKFYDHLISLNNLRGTKLLCRISVLISVEASNIVRSMKGLLNPTPPPPQLPDQTDITINDQVIIRPTSPTAPAGIPKRKDYYGTSFKLQAENLMLVLAMLTAAATFSAACAFAGAVSKDSDETAGRDFSSLAGPFVLLNSTGFIASVAVIMSVLNTVPLKPWPQISVCCWFGSYMCLMMKLSPHEALLLLCVSVPLLLLAATGKIFKFSQWV
nr:serine/threonine-protein kinase TNNI3K-like [Ipomoea batatas]